MHSEKYLPDSFEPAAVRGTFSIYRANIAAMKSNLRIESSRNSVGMRSCDSDSQVFAHTLLQVGIVMQPNRAGPIRDAI